MNEAKTIRDRLREYATERRDLDRIEKLLAITETEPSAFFYAVRHIASRSHSDHAQKRYIILAEALYKIRTETPAELPTEEEPTKTPTAEEKPAKKAHNAPKVCYNILIYTTPAGVKRAEIRKAGKAFLDIPAAELEAIRAEIARKDPDRVIFQSEERPAENPTKDAPRLEYSAAPSYVIEYREETRRKYRAFSDTEYTAAEVSAEVARLNASGSAYRFRARIATA